MELKFEGASLRAHCTQSPQSPLDEGLVPDRRPPLEETPALMNKGRVGDATVALNDSYDRSQRHGFPVHGQGFLDFPQLFKTGEKVRWKNKFS